MYPSAVHEKRYGLNAAELIKTRSELSWSRPCCLFVVISVIPSVSVFYPHMQPNAGNGVDGVGKNHLVVGVEVPAPFREVGKLGITLAWSETFGHQVVREQV